MINELTNIPTCNVCSDTPFLQVGYRVICNNCGGRTDWFESEKEASAAWKRMNRETTKRDEDTPTAEEFWGNK